MGAGGMSKLIGAGISDPGAIAPPLDYGSNILGAFVSSAGSFGFPRSG